MATRSGAQDPYVYPPPDDATLRNLFDERDPAVLHRLEHVEVLERYRQLAAGEVVLDRTFDAAHVKAIHGHLFEDVYEWAGTYREINIWKDDRGFADANTGEIDLYLTDVHRLVTGTAWPDLDRDGFAERAAAVFAHLNQAHPFREGNGRTSKLFMNHVSELSGFALDYAAVTPEVWNERSMLSAPDLGRYEPVPDLLIPMFTAIVIDRP